MSQQIEDATFDDQCNRKSPPPVLLLAQDVQPAAPLIPFPRFRWCSRPNRLPRSLRPSNCTATMLRHQAATSPGSSTLKVSASSTFSPYVFCLPGSRQLAISAVADGGNSLAMQMEFPVKVANLSPERENLSTSAPPNWIP